jgi:hypothetical protein
MKVYQTNKLFFKKWPYKVETNVPKVNLIKEWGISRTIDICTGKWTPSWSTKQLSADQKLKLHKYIYDSTEFLNSAGQLRFERDTCNFYTDDYELYKKMCTEMSPWIVSITEPASEDDLKILQEKSRYHLCDQLPYNKYKYKVYMRERMPATVRNNFAKWLENYTEHVKISANTRNWLSGYEHWIQDPFLYVADGPNLSMITMFLGEYVKKTQEFVLRDIQ